jgi:hypothetical protein
VNELGWVPKQLDVIDDIRNGSYRDKYKAQKETGIEAFSWASHG